MFRRVRKVLFFLFPVLLLIPVLLLAFLSQTLPSAPVPALTPSQHSGLGGAFGATSYSLPASATATPVVNPPKMYGGSGAGGACLGTSGAGNDMIKMDFGWSASVLNRQWQDYATYRLCNDRYTWETATQMPIEKVLQQLGWPSLKNPPDLLQPQYDDQIVMLQPLSSFDPVTQQAQQQAQQQANGQSTETNKNCLWHVSFAFINGDIDICQPIRLIVNEASAGVRWGYQSTASQISFMWQTPLQPFQDDKTSGLLTIWSTSWAIVLICITAVIAYGGLRYMLGSAVSWLAYANIAELIPRLLFGLLAAYFSREFFIMLIQGNNALAGIFNHDTLDTVINGKAAGVVTESLQIMYGLMGLCLMIEEVARMAILYLLFAFAPILFFFASLRETQRWAKTAAVAAVVFVFMQAAQMATLDVGGRVLGTILKNTGGNLTLLNILVSLAILYLTLLLFFSLARMALGGGIYPYADGAFRMSRRVLPAAAGAVGAAAGALRQFRRNAFPLPPRYPPNWGTSGGFRGPSGSDSGGQTSVTVGAKPFVSHGNGQGPGGPAGTQNGGPGGKKPNGPAGPAGKKTGGVGPGGAQTASPAAARPPLATQGKANGAALSGAAAPGVSRPSAVQHSGSAPSSQAGAGQWQKTPPPQKQRRRMTEQEFMDWMNAEDEH
jgi:hypothetical protein